MLTFEPNTVTAVVLGNMQDGGLPHTGCMCPNCQNAAKDSSLSSNVACLGIVDTRAGDPSVWLIDATPDIGEQLRLLSDVLGPHPIRKERLRQPDGIFLTHAHFGHIGGLSQLGTEVMAVKNQKVHATQALCDLVSETDIWSPLVRRLDLSPLEIERPIELAEGLTITPVSVPHRDEWNVGTVAFQIEGPDDKKLLYLPDIDSWNKWERARQILSGVDVALVDATFFSTAELGGREPIAHPLVTDTLEQFSGMGTRIVLTHLNHTNPLVDRDSEESERVHNAGMEIARTGDRFRL